MSPQVGTGDGSTSDQSCQAFLFGSRAISRGDKTPKRGLKSSFSDFCESSATTVQSGYHSPSGEDRELVT
ncbi:hypothetical protein RRG08_062031 [Elysia crispata]|uniref:Uncharacterized protein n=1 Tax=Elysia crispata TaxID=231223 RepID=A0AAE1A3B0_9GAST|nr:hypothetical protein RRG08_062031 [Elysia crispata]